MSTETDQESETGNIIDISTMGTGRIEAFSDGVIAIAITLLVLDIRVPHLPTGVTSGLWGELLKLWPSYGGYLVSFLIIGIIWISHHQLYQLIERTNHTFLALNVLFLMVVSFLPFPTGLLAEYVQEGHEQQVATIVYSGSMFAMAFTFNFMWRYASYSYRLIKPDLSLKLINSITQKYDTGCIFNLIAFIISFVSYEVSLAMIVLLALYFLTPGLPGLAARSRQS